MSAPIIPVPLYPAVPSVDGVPAVNRAVNGLATQIVGNLTGSIADQNFTGIFTGQLIQSTGLISALSNNPISGVLDQFGNVAATLSGSVGGVVNGIFSGAVGSGAISGALSGVSSQLSGDFGDLATTDIASGGETSQPQLWGIYDSSGNAVVKADNILRMEWQGNYRIANYPIEDGGFESYNKVKVPYDARFSMTRGGTVTDRTEFLDALDKVLASLDLYVVTSPEKTYANANVVHVDYDRSALHGAGLITAEVWLQEVRVAPGPAFSNTKQPSGADQENVGTVQPQIPSTQQWDPANNALTTDLF